MVQLNLKKKDTENIKKRSQDIKLVDILQESRSGFNELVDAFNAINEAVEKLSAKLDAHPVHELRNSIDFNATSITDVQTKLMPALENKMNAHVNKVKASLDLKVKESVEKVEAQEGHSRRRNIIINGLTEVKGEKVEEVVSGFFVDKLKLDKNMVDTFLYRDSHRLPKGKNSDGTVREGPRPLIVAFLKQKDRNLVLKNAFQLKGTDFSLKSDLPKTLNDLRVKMLQERTRLKGTDPHTKYRVAERSYRPVLQKEDGLIEGTTYTKWKDVDFKG